MKQELNEIEINGVKYVKEGTSQSVAKNTDGLKYVIIRNDTSDVFAGYLEAIESQKVKLINSRCLYYYDGAASIYQLSQDGTNKPDNCKFTCVVPDHNILNVIEILGCSNLAMKSIQGVKVWEK